MVDIEGLPAWARRQLVRRFERGSSERIVRWMSIPGGRGVGPGLAADDADTSRASDNVVTFVPRPDAAPTSEHPRAVAVG